MRRRVLVVMLAMMGWATAASAQPTIAVLDSLMDTHDIPKPVLQVFARAYDEDWVWFGGANHQNFFFLPQTIQTTERGTQTVWTANVQDADPFDWLSSRAAVLEARRKRGASASGYDKYLMTRLQWELDCTGRRAAIVEIVDVDEDGKTLVSGKTGAGLEAIVPDSNAEGLLRSLCSAKGRTTFRDIVNTPMGVPVAQSR